jgi:hypothetical protein
LVVQDCATGCENSFDLCSCDFLIEKACLVHFRETAIVCRVKESDRVIDFGPTLLYGRVLDCDCRKKS